MISYKRISIKFILFVALFCVFVPGYDACSERERGALLSFRNGLIDEYGILSSWRSNECYMWYGVECNNTTGHVVALRLNAANYYGGLQGEVGSSLLELHHLNYLDLSWNDFGGNSIPKFIGSMRQLQHLYLTGSNFAGTVPPQIVNLTNLQSLDLSHNDFGGNPIPGFIGSMKQLQHLFLVASNFSGIVPPQLGNLTNLQSLMLSVNSLRVKNLDWLSSLSLLSRLSLSHIDLSHTIWLPQILRLHSLYELRLNSCNISTITLVEPSANSSSTSLSILLLSNNQLTSSSFHWLSNISMFIEHLDLSNNMLQGQIPKFLFNLSRLRVLVLYENDLGGNVDELFGNTSEKGILESLQILDLAQNKLYGSVPDLRAFSTLKEVYFGGNNLTGFIPPSIDQLSELRVLDLSNNLLEGVISESHLIKLNKLKKLDLSFNSLTLHFAPDWSPTFQLDAIFLAGCNVGPSFPKWIQTQRNLTFLDLSRANIADEVPTWLWSVSPSLYGLYLSDNQITGTVPNLSNTSIRDIDLSNNSISGPIPLFRANTIVIQLSENMFSGSVSSICKAHYGQLWNLDLSNNQLAGEVPNCWEKMPNLAFLNLANNGFSGEIPDSLESLHGLLALQLRGNSLSGEFPSTLRHCQKLWLVDVAGNELTGEISTWIGELYNTEFLNLGRNKLHGSIPVEICNLTRIRILDLSKNNLSGNIPDCFNNFTSLAQKNIPTYLVHPSAYLNFAFYNYNLPNVIIIVTYYEFSLIQWKGRESEYRKNLKLLKLIDFSSNRLSGNIPHSFSSMKGLISLNLSSNSFKGNIIPNIGDMEMLECLDLSNNQLSGKIPTSLAQLQYLSVLDLSSNNLSGKIPTSTQLQSFNASAYAENKRLCGPPLAICPEDSLKPSTASPGGNMNEKDGNNLSFMQEVGISMGFGFIFGFWGVVCTFILKKSWRIAFFNWFDDVGDWFYVRIAIFVSKLSRS
ncbi:receptor-like protein EIX1 [Salvia divinorum]|uniref:Receptor-like protein EIX1 n=1 Tax=Salvia divinorum TaxID=28513 RepID=A0ABD1HY28_SALDI